MIIRKADMQHRIIVFYLFIGITSAQLDLIMPLIGRIGNAAQGAFQSSDKGQFNWPTFIQGVTGFDLNDPMSSIDMVSQIYNPSLGGGVKRINGANSRVRNICF